ncbi:AMP-binding enzyme [Sphingomonas zeicaulis]|uniref:AMP-binding enzyme n=1 Tax=Sphingomonas zeicaulis TaxID=1632740 RepID=UPI003D1C4F77
MIKSAGSNVSPAEVEMEMQQLEGVHSAYVVGLPDEECGQLVVAAVVPRAYAAIARKEVPAPVSPLVLTTAGSQGPATARPMRPNSRMLPAIA